MKTYKGFKVGDRVKVKLPDEGYDLGKEILQSDIGTIKSFPPKVRIVKRPPLFDSLSYFAYVEFDRIVDKVHNNKLRGGIDICNLKHAKETNCA
jgi:hypothetical protein